MSDPVNDIIVGGIDQTLPMENAQKDILKRVDEIMEQAITENNPEIAAHAIKSLLGVSRIGGLALAKFIYTFDFAWDNFKRRESFLDYAEETFGITKVTVDRYFRVWEMLVSGDIPKDNRQKLELKPIKSLIPIANLVKQGYEVEGKHWTEFANAPDVTTVNKICRKIKGTEPKAGTLSLELERDGTLVAWKDGQKFTLGYLNINDKDEVVQKGIERLISDKVLVK